MNKSDLVNSIAQSANISKVAAERGLNGMLNSISGAIEDGERVTLVGFGSWSLVERAPRLGRNIQTGEAVKIPSRRAIRFVPGKKLVKRLR